jgi:acetyltransferase-like isoleucine patch superfamily enzyme
MIKSFIPKKIRHWIITIWHKYKYNLIVGSGTYISKSEFEKNCAVGNNCQVTNTEVGKYSYITEGARISHAKIGKFCSIGPNLRVGMATHPIKKFVSTSPMFHSKYTNLNVSFVKKNEITTHKYIDKKKLFFIEIENDVWIGANVTIMDGVKIGSGAVIGANSLVTKNIPPYAVAVGMPAKIINYRFNKSEIRKLLNLEWWNRDDEWLIHKINLFKDVKKFLKNGNF